MGVAPSYCLFATVHYDRKYPFWTLEDIILGLLYFIKPGMKLYRNDLSIFLGNGNVRWTAD